jgi:predicted dinucleotide-binding enzyme
VWANIAGKAKEHEMKIAAIGTGHVGAALGTGWARAGRDVVFGSREPQSPEVRQLIRIALRHDTA